MLSDFARSSAEEINRADLREAIAKAVSGAPFPSRRSLAKADAVLALLPQTQAVCDASPDDEDMADVGRSLMDAIALATADQSNPLYGWSPAQDPAEVVFDLINLVQEGFDWKSFVVRWAADRWRAEVQNRPLQNVHRRALDTTWRQVMRHFGGDPDALVGPDHDELVCRAGKEG